MHQKEKFFIFSKKIANQSGIDLGSSSYLLDLGASRGEIVNLARSANINAFGVDFYEDNNLRDKIPKYCHQILGKKINGLDYKIPFEDNYFDITLSQNVFEHVMNYDLTLSELSRVMKNGGISINLFPSRYRIVEPHVLIPGATIFQKVNYLKYWSWYSRKKFNDTFHSKMSDKELAEKHNYWLSTETNYLSRKQIISVAKKYFSEVNFIDKQFFCFWPGGVSKLYPYVKFFPFLFKLHSSMRMRILYLKK